MKPLNLQRGLAQDRHKGAFSPLKLPDRRSLGEHITWVSRSSRHVASVHTKPSYIDQTGAMRGHMDGDGANMRPLYAEAMMDGMRQMQNKSNESSERAATPRHRVHNQLSTHEEQRSR